MGPIGPIDVATDTLAKRLAIRVRFAGRIASIVVAAMRHGEALLEFRRNVRAVNIVAGVFVASAAGGAVRILSVIPFAVSVLIR